MPSSRQLKTKIGATKNIQQITKAMEMVSATKMRKSQDVALRARPYAKKSFALLSHLLSQAEKEETQSIFWQSNVQALVGSDPTRRTALVVVTSDKGLCGNFNGAVLRRAMQVKEEVGGVDIIAVGRKGRDFFKRREVPVAVEFFQFSDIVTLQDVIPLADWILSAYEKKEYDKIIVCSTDFVSALSQQVVVRQLLPLRQEELREFAGEDTDLKDFSFVLEPSREAVMEQLVRDLLRVAIVHWIFESNASEHSARMMAMKNASDNADDLIEELNLQMNKSRQAAITQELTEIATAKEALTSE
jgi:F-type H+-transporting ATPase subunit gamma